MQPEPETVNRKKVGPKNTKDNDEIPAKIIQFHWPTQEKWIGILRPEQT
jgi:hypothetical protein